MTPPPTPGAILVADDDGNDVFFMRRLFGRMGVEDLVVVFRDGEELITFLRPIVNAGEKTSLPRLVILDIKMPRRNGFEVLRWIREQDAMKELPIVVLSGSGLPCDRQRALELGATHFVVKDPAMGTLAQIVSELVPAAN